MVNKGSNRMNEKLSIAEFAKVVGTSAKTIYTRINNNSNLPVNEQLKTVNEKIKGREVTLILTNLEQIEIYKKIYGKEPVINGEYYENVTVNESIKPVSESKEIEKNSNNNDLNNSVIEKLMKVFESNNDRILQLTNELITAKQKQLLLEDKAGREGFYIDENNKLQKEIKTNEENHKKVIESKDKLIKVLITFLVINIMGILMLITYFITVNNLNNTETEKPSIEQVSTVENVNNKK